MWGLSDLGFEWPKSCLALDLPQVLEVVRANYDTLTLKLQDGLDQYERYSEQHKEAAFFKELVSLPRLHPCLCVLRALSQPVGYIVQVCIWGTQFAKGW